VKLGVLDEAAAEVFALTTEVIGSCVTYYCCCRSLLRHCQEAAHGAPDDPLSPCCGFSKGEHFVEGF